MFFLIFVLESFEKKWNWNLNKIENLYWPRKVWLLHLQFTNKIVALVYMSVFFPPWQYGIILYQNYKQRKALLSHFSAPVVSFFIFMFFMRFFYLFIFFISDKLSLTGNFRQIILSESGLATPSMSLIFMADRYIKFILLHITEL